MSETGVEALVEGRSVTYKKFFEVPVDLAFEAWSSHEHLSRWWGPDGFTLTTASLDFKDGGLWDFTMHGPDGHDYRNRIRFREIRWPSLIRYAHLGDGEGDKDVAFESELVFEPSGSGTLLTMRQTFPSAEELERVAKKYHAVEGGRQHLAKFGRYAASLKRR